ncbi:MAG: hypothetical protein R8G66_24540 [Cytophagales bacterium]|nr:hypothetical protein [Cytophagales bacterium]
MKFPSLFILSFFFLSHAISASSEQDMVVTLADTLYGEVHVDFITNKIRIRNDKNYQFITASQVRWIKKTDRHYCVAAFGVESRYFIFEVLSKGGKSLLYREGVKFNPYDDEAFPPFFVLEDRSAYSLATKKDVLSTFGQRQKKVKEFVKANGLSFESREDLSRIFDYYNDEEQADL